MEFYFLFTRDKHNGVSFDIHMVSPYCIEGEKDYAKN